MHVRISKAIMEQGARKMIRIARVLVMLEAVCAGTEAMVFSDTLLTEFTELLKLELENGMQKFSCPISQFC